MQHDLTVSETKIKEIANALRIIQETNVLQIIQETDDQELWAIATILALSYQQSMRKRRERLRLIKSASPIIQNSSIGQGEHKRK